jgi:hypothetical protein
MSSFTEPLITRKLSARLWQTERAFNYHVGSEESPNVITVPSGFITDFASSPWLMWWLIPPDGEYTQAAVLHDYLYVKQIYVRKEADDIFLEAMVVLDVPIFKRWLMYRAVRMWGWWPWNNYKKKKSYE